MAQHKKDLEMLHCRIDRILSEVLNKLCEEYDVTREHIRQVIEKKSKESENNE